MSDHLATAWKLTAAEPNMSKLHPDVLKGCRTVFMIGALSLLEAVDPSGEECPQRTLFDELRAELAIELGVDDSSH